MITELQAMVGEGALKIMPGPIVGSADELVPKAALQTAAAMEPMPTLSAHEAVLSAENDSLRLLLEQAGIDAKVLLAQAGIDAEEREAADKLQKLILGELHHRIKNTLATVSAIASQSFRAAISTEHGQEAMEGRLAALGRAHDLLMQISWSNASLTHTFSDATEPFESQGAKRFHFNGPDIRITSGAVIALAMTFNELCTNTTKFGALSIPTGRVEIAWTIDNEKQRLRLTWTEKAGPPVKPPGRRSFGTRMMESLGQQLNGKVQLSYDTSGFSKKTAIGRPLRVRRFQLTGDQYDLDAGPTVVNRVGELEAVHGSRHLDVSKKQGYIRAGLQNGHRLVGIDGFDRVEARILHDIHGTHSQHHFVLDDEDVRHVG